MSTTDTQNTLILEALQRGEHLTPIEALERFGSFRLASRINELRQAGHVIITDKVKAGKKKYASYRLIPKEPKQLTLV